MAYLVFRITFSNLIHYQLLFSDLLVYQNEKTSMANIIILLIGVYYINAYIGVHHKQEINSPTIRILSYNVRIFNAYKWIPELKIGDLIALLVSGITFVFAYKGFEGNREQFKASNLPIIVEHLSSKIHEGKLSFSIKNQGSGVALNCKYRYIR